MATACLPERPVEPLREAAQNRTVTRTVTWEQARRIRTSDDDLAELADKLPGFGGYYYDDQQRLTVWLTDPGRAGEAQVRMTEFLRARGGRARNWAEVNAARAAGMRVRQAQHDFRQLLTWYRGHVLPNVMRLEGITMTDIDERVNRIQVGVATAGHVESTRSFLARLPIPEGVVEVVVVEARTVPDAGPAGDGIARATLLAAEDLQGTVRPVVGGARIQTFLPAGQGAGQLCSVGFNLLAWVSGTVSSERYFVTNSHCLSPIGTMNGWAVAQAAAPGFIGIETLDPAQFPCVNVGGGIPTSDPCRFTDAVLVKYDSPDFPNQGAVAVPGVGQTSFTSTTSITEIYAPEVGRPVEMIASLSGRSGGTVIRSCVHLVSTQNIWYLCQGRATYSSQNIDSGSPVIERLGDGAVAWAVGLHWGHIEGTNFSAFSPMYSVVTDLYSQGIGLLDPTTAPVEPPVLPSPPPDFEVAVHGMTLVGPTTVCTWTAVVTGGQSPFEYSWSGLLTGTDWFVTGGMATSGYLNVAVVDALGVERSASLLIDFDPEAQLDCM